MMSVTRASAIRPIRSIAPYRPVICFVLAAAMLFAQIIVSAHACTYAVGKPVVAGETIVAAPAGAVDAGKHCESMAERSTSTSAPMSAQCAEHCQYGQQVDQTLTVTLPAAVLTPLYPVPARPVQRAPAIGAAIAPSPPHSILHCCFLI